MKTTLTRVMTFFMVLFLATTIAHSQQIVTSAATVTLCPGTDTVEIAVTVQNFTDVATISLSLLIDTNQVHFVSYTVNPVLAGENLIVFNPGNKVKTGYFGLNTISLPDDAVLLTYKFHVTGSSSLVWDLANPGECQYSDFDGDPLPATFYSGAINIVQPYAYLYSTPQLCEGTPSTLSFNFTAGMPPYTVYYTNGQDTSSFTTTDNPYTFLTGNITETTTWTLLSLTDGNGCVTDNINQSATSFVTPLPLIFNLSGGGTRCENGPPLTIELDSSQQGYLYLLILNENPHYSLSGTGSALNFGLYDAGIYTVEVVTNCGTFLMNGSATINVIPLPAVSFTEIDTICYGTPAFALNTGSPAGGIYSGPGVENGMFNSYLTGTGSIWLTYTYWDVNGCENSAYQFIVVRPLPDVYLEPLYPICGNTDPITLTGYPAGGEFSGPGVVNNMFYPLVAGTGTHTLTYTYSDNYCSNTATQLVDVYPMPVVTLAPVDPLCVDAYGVALEGSPEGGWYTGMGVYYNWFYPYEAGVGTWTITYHYMNQYGCTDSAAITVTVNPLPELSIEPIGPFCMDAPAVPLVATPAGGTFFGEGVVNESFDPSLAYPGSTTIMYFYTDANGCSNEISTAVTVYYLPDVYLDFLPSVCLTSDPVTLYGWPLGGIYSGTGVSGNMFYPSVAGIGTFTLTYTYTDEQGCTNSSYQNITVNSVISVDFTLPDTICINADPFDMMPSPDGGWFYGPGTYGNWFYPYSAGEGTWTITYNYDDNGCPASASHFITVIPLPELTIDQVNGLCVDAEPVVLSASPAGGSFSGTGVVDGIFYPELAGPGFWTVFYTYTSTQGCFNETYAIIPVYPLPELYLYFPSTICPGADPIQLEAYPAGGIFSGVGVSDNMFYPAIAGEGTWTITYSFTDENGCTSVAVADITVTNAVEVTFSPLSDVCYQDNPFVLEGGSPYGGVYSGPGVIDGYFYPYLAGAGTFTITYTFDAGNGCSSFATQDITVNINPLVIFNPLPTVCVNEDPFALSAASPEGGVYSGPGVIDGVFYPAFAGIGEWIISYQYTDDLGCSTTGTAYITVIETPLVTFDPIAPVCVDAAPFLLTGGFPTGGVYSGDGVIDGYFYPALTGVGTFTIIYTYSIPGSCSNIEPAYTSITVLPVTEVVTSPVSLAMDEGNDAIFTVIAENATSYQWQVSVNDGDAWSDLIDYPYYLGSNTDILYLPGVNFGMNGFLYRVIVDGVCGEVVSEAAMLTVYPVITITAGNVDVCSSEIIVPLTTTHFYSVASMSLALNYNDAVLTYTGYQNLNAELASGIIDVNAFGNQVLIGYYSLIPANIGDGHLLDLVFSSTLGYSDLTWEVNSMGNGELLTLDLHQLTVNFIDGSTNAHPIAEVTLEAVEPLCLNAGAVELFGNPAGGEYSGPGTVGNMFFPETAGVGTWTISYTYTAGPGCFGTASIDITVKPIPEVTLEPLPNICLNADPFELTSGLPLNGTYDGPGVYDGIFFPAITGPGSWMVTYTVTDENGCSNSAMQYITVIENPVVSMEQIGDVCLDANPVMLSGTPEGGVFSGPGVIGNMFYPAEAGLGSWTLSYNYTDANNCSAVEPATISVTVLPLTSISSSPVSIILDEGNDAFFAVTAENATSYQWQVSLDYGDAWSDLSDYPYYLGSNSDLLQLPSVNLSMNGYLYRVIVEGNCGTVISEAAMLSVYPVITMTIANVEGCAGEFVVPVTTSHFYDVASISLAINYDENILTFTGYQNVHPELLEGFLDINANSSKVWIAYYNIIPVNIGDGLFVELLFASNGGYAALTWDVNTPGNVELHNIDLNQLTSYFIDGSVYAYPMTAVSIDAIAPLCAGADPVALSGMPEGGTFSGPGVIDGVFYPSLTGTGTFTIIYTITDANNCVNSAEQNITVLPELQAGITPVEPLCTNSDAVALTGQPAGGVFSGDGVIDGYFYPAIVGNGIFTIFYHVTDEYGCSAVASTTIEVNPIPEITLTAIDPLCLNSDPVNLVAEPTGGEFSGPGVINNMFYPSESGVGTFIITYTAVNEYNCSNSAEMTIQVNPNADVTIDPLGPFCHSDDFAILNGYPEGGQFSGSGVIGNVFYPGLVDPGTYTIYYTWEPDACGGIAFTEVTVNPVPEATFTGETTICAGASANLQVNITDMTDGPWWLEFADGSEYMATDNNFILVVNPLETTTYVLHKITNVAGCFTILDIPLTVTVEAYPATFEVSGGGDVCYETTTVDINLSGSQSAYWYTLYFNGSPTNYVIPGDGEMLTFTISPPVSGTYTVIASSAFGCTQLMNGSAQILVQPELFADAGPDVIMLSGSTTTLHGTGSGGTGPYTYFWMPSAGFIDPADPDPTISPLVTTTYVLMVMDATGCMAIDEVTVTVLEIQDDITGTLTYLNDVSTPMNNCTINLLNNGIVVASTITDPDGHYSFTDLPFGIYTLEAITSKAWGGGNAADGLLMLKHFVGQSFLTGLFEKAGDVTGETKINAHDALNTMRRFVGLLENFAPVGDWVFEHPSIIIDGYNNQLVDFSGLCMGDVNGDYLPPNSKHQPTVFLKNEGTVIAQNGMIDIPVIAEQQLIVGAISLVFDLPSGVEVSGVRLTGDNTSLFFNQLGTELRIAWCSLEPMNIAAGETLLTISLKNKSHLASFSLSLQGSSTLSDENAATIQYASLRIASFSSATVELEVSNFPNPFSQTTQISYVLPEDGKVILNVYNLLGEKVGELVNANQAAGTYQLTLDGSSLQQGTYFYTLEFSTANRKLKQNGRMNISR